MTSEFFVISALLLIISANAVKDLDKYFKINEPINVCCEMDHGENQAVALYQGTRRLRSLLRTANYSQIDANSKDFFADHPGYSMKDVSEYVESLCVEKNSPGALVDDNNLTFKCELIDNMGLGAINDTQQITIRVYEIPVVSNLLPLVTSVVGAPVSIKCSATGRPNLKLRWKNEVTQETYAETTVASLDHEGRAELSFTLDSVAEDQDGQMLVCEATTTHPPDQPAVRQFTRLSVNYPPRIKIENKIVYTHLGATENLEIIVAGKPTPVLNCDHLSDIEPREVKLEEGGEPGASTFHLRVENVKTEDVGDYLCSARNDLGTATETVHLTLGPTPPEVVSSKFTGHSDYYLLGWRSRSKSALQNVTFQIKSMENSNAESGAPKFDLKEVSRTVSLNDPTVARSDLNDSSLQEFWHHISNLSHDTEHKIHISACNTHGCTKSDSDIPHIIFRTRDEGSAKIDPDVLVQPPSAALRAAASEEFERTLDPGRNSADYCSHLTSSVFASTIIILLPSYFI